MIECRSHRREIRGSSYVCADCGEDLGSLRKVADKYNDYLMNPKARPDLQTPEAQNFLKNLQQNFLNERTDAMLPWVTREWKKGRMENRPWNPARLNYQVQFPGGGLNSHELTPQTLNHWADWYHSNHPTRQGVDMMSLKAPDMHQRIQDWEQAMKKERTEGPASSMGQVVHKYPDGWTMQNLNNEKALVDEGDAMGHCVGGGSYWPSVQDGSTLIYSLRDEKNKPHATMEMTPDRDECANCQSIQTSPNRGPGWSRDPCVDCGHVGETVPSPSGAMMVQIQGKSNEAPKPEYQQRIKDYFKTFGMSRPHWEDQDIHDADDLLDDEGGYRVYHPGDYGLEEPDIDYDWPNIVQDHANTNLNYPGQYHHDPHDIAQKAMETGNHEDLKSAVEDWGVKAEDDYRQREWDNWVNDPEGAAQNHGLDPIETYGMEPGVYDDEFYNPETGDIDEEAYDKAHAEWEEERDHKLEELRDEAIDQSWWDSDENQFVHDWAEALYANNPGGRRAAAELPCEVCGDPLEGGKCKRCDWGGWSDVMGDENPPDATRDVKPAVQS